MSTDEYGYGSSGREVSLAYQPKAGAEKKKGRMGERRGGAAGFFTPMDDIAFHQGNKGGRQEKTR